MVQLGNEHGRNPVQGRAAFLVDGGKYQQRVKNYKLTIFTEVNNILNQPLRYFIGGNKNTTTQVEYYNVKFNFGLKFNL